MGYRPDHAGFELNFGSVLSGILPASLKSAGIGSVLVVSYWIVTSISSSDQSLFTSVGSALVALVVGTFFGTIVGTIMCAFYIAVIGAPVALLLGARIEHRISGAIALIVAVGAGIAAALSLVGNEYGLDGNNLFEIIGAAFVYAIPAGIFYRKAVISARQISPWYH